MTMSGFEEQTSESVLTRDIPWETYMTARLITDKELQLIRRFVRTPDANRASLLEEAGPSYIQALLSVLRNVTKEETVQYVLALLDRTVTVEPKAAKMMHMKSDQASSSSPDPYATFSKLLHRQDWFSQERACKLMTKCIETHPDAAVLAQIADENAASKPAASHLHNVVVQLLDWLCGQIRRPAHPSLSQPAAVNALSKLLKQRAIRELFLRGGSVPLLVTVLRDPNTAKNNQLAYEATLCVWEMSYLKAAADVMASSGVVSLLVNAVKHAQKEKVVRVALLALKNLVQSEGLGCEAEMFEAGLHKILPVRLLQNWGDEDIPDVIQFLEDQLQQDMAELSNFEKYRKEVLSGALDWTPMHTQDTFWTENVKKFEEKDFQILRVLQKLLETSREAKTLAVGCHDLGMFITHHPQGRYIVSDLRGKELVMRLMSHPDPDVQKQALLCVQKIMLSKDKLDWLQNLTAAA